MAAAPMAAFAFPMAVVAVAAFPMAVVAVAAFPMAANPMAANPMAAVPMTQVAAHNPSPHAIVPTRGLYATSCTYHGVCTANFQSGY